MNMTNTSYRLLTGMWPMPGPIRWLSNQRTMVPTRASVTATQVMRLPMAPNASRSPLANRLIQ